MSAALITILSADVDLEFFVSSDIYRYDIDNRPLGKLRDNDVLIAAGANAVIQETYNARTDVTPTSFANLKARLDSMDSLSGSSSKIVHFDMVQDRARLWRAQWGSGFFCKTGEIYDANQVETLWATYGDTNIPYGAIVVPTIAADGTGPAGIAAKTVNINLSHTRLPSAGYRPLDVMVAGYHVRLYSEAANGAAAPALPNGVSILFPAAPSTGFRFDLAFLEVWAAPVEIDLLDTDGTDSFYPYGSVDSTLSRTVDYSDPSIQGSVWFNPATGDYVQIRHRIRVVSGVDYNNQPFGISDSATVNAQGGAGSPVASHPFVNGATLYQDSGVWVAGDGGSGDKTALGSIDGRVLGIPIMIVSRQNTATWTVATNQNGGTARPDFRTHNFFVAADIIDLRSQGFNQRQTVEDMAEETFDKLLRGKLHTVLGQLEYDTTGTFLGDFNDVQSVYGSEVTEVSYIGTTEIAHTNAVRDLANDGVALSVAKPYDFRRLYAPTRDDQVTAFHLSVIGSVTAPTDFIQWSSPTITLKAAGASGLGPSNATIKTIPILMWRGSKAPVKVGAWSGIGTNTATVTVDTADSFYTGAVSPQTMDGVVTISYPAGTGIRHAPNKVLYQDFVKTDGTTVVDSQKIKGFNGPTGMFTGADGRMYVCDSGNHRVIRYTSGGVIDAQFPGTLNSLPGLGADNAHLNFPTAVAVDGAGNMFIVDTENHRVIKVSSTMVYQSQFGTTGTAQPDNGHLNTPRGVAVDGSGNVYVSDTFNFRVVKLNSSLAYVSQFGTQSTPAVGNSSNATCLAPQGLSYGGDSKLYVADAARVLVLDPTAMDGTGPVTNTDHGLLNILVGGQGLAEGSAIAALHAIESLNIVEDSDGNKYVSGGATSGVYKFSPDYVLLAQFGSGTNNTTDGTLWTGPGDSHYNTRCGLPRGIAYDAAHTCVFVADNTFNSSASQYSRVLVLDSTTLAYRHQYLITKPRPWMGGPGLPLYPTPPYPDVWIDLAVDPVGKFIYLSLNLLAAVEKISYTTDDPSTWSFTGLTGTKYGAGSYSYSWPGYQGWRGAADNKTRLSYPGRLALSLDYAHLFVGDQNLSQFAAGHYASRVVKIQTSDMSYEAHYGDLTAIDIGADASSPHLQWVTGIVPITDGTDRIYVSDARSNPPTVSILTYSAWDDHGSVGTLQEVITDPSWISEQVPSGPGQHNFLSINGLSYDKTTLFINPGFATQRWAIDTGLVTGATKDVPLRAYLAGSSFFQPIQFPTSFENVSSVWQDGTSSTLLICDQSANVIYALSTPSYFPLGEAGTPGVSAFGYGGWASPSGVAINTISGTQYLYFLDVRNNCLIKSSPYYAFVERGTGRIETLLPLPAATRLRIYTSYTPYQGIYQKKDLLGGNHTELGNLMASRLIVKPSKILCVTRGRVGIEAGGLNGDTAYASPLSHLPKPNGGATEYAWQGQLMQFEGDMISPSSMVLLDAIQKSSSPREYEGDNESFYDRDTLVSTPIIGTPLPIATGGGYISFFGPSNSSPTLRTFSLSAPNVHANYTYGVLDYMGELLLYVRGEVQFTTRDNIISPVGVNPDQNDVIELFRMSGQPFVKFEESR